MAITQSEIDTIVALSKSYGATRLILFGSALSPGVSVRDIDLACDGVEGWKLYELASRIEDRLRMPLDIVPLKPATRFTRLIEARGRVLL